MTKYKTFCVLTKNKSGIYYTKVCTKTYWKLVVMHKCAEITKRNWSKYVECIYVNIRRS